MKSETVIKSNFKNLDLLAKLMDSQFRVPGTNIRFGMDALLGLVPGVGDIAGFLISAYMLVILTKNGASGYVLARMALNVLIDVLFGSVPLLGDVFDVAFKANSRNMKLMHEHYVSGRHQGGAWKVVVPVLFVLTFLVAAFIWFAYRLLICWYHNIS